jgi:hypothetical protein
MLENSWVAERLATSQEGLSAMKLVASTDHLLFLLSPISEMFIVSMMRGYRHTCTFLFTINDMFRPCKTILSYVLAASLRQFPVEVNAN